MKITPWLATSPHRGTDARRPRPYGQYDQYNRRDQQSYDGSWRYGNPLRLRSERVAALGSRHRRDGHLQSTNRPSATTAARTGTRRGLSRSCTSSTRPPLTSMSSWRRATAGTTAIPRLLGADRLLQPELSRRSATSTRSYINRGMNRRVGHDDIAVSNGRTTAVSSAPAAGQPFRSLCPRPLRPLRPLRRLQPRRRPPLTTPAVR